LQFIRTARLPAFLPVTLLGLAIPIEIVASVLVYKSRRFAKNPDISETYFIARCVLPAPAADSRREPDGVPPELRSRISSNDADREWWSRLSGWVLLVMISWVTVTGICLIGCYLPNVL